MGVVTFKTDVYFCARCGQDHKQLEFKKFQRPVADTEGDWDYWTICPSSDDPILLRTEKREDDNPSSITEITRST